MDRDVAAKINNRDITVHQVQALLQRQPRLAEERPEVAAKLALDSLVEQELAAQAAQSQGLDRDPQVLQYLELARREVLARAYQDRLALSAAGVGSNEVDQFYDDQPALFGDRRVYTLREFAFTAPPDQLHEVRTMVRESKDARDLDARLTAAGVSYISRVFGQAAEDIPAGLLRQLAPLSAGQSVVAEHATGVRVYFVLALQSAAVERRHATEAIRRYLSVEKQRDVVQQGMKDLRRQASVEYVGGYGAPVPTPASAASAIERTTTR
jgi:EpsD family peptidyl-prolyl cis-trans isomerase